jgi:hypothetical protein
VGSRIDLANVIASCSRVPIDVLKRGDMDHYNVAEKMSWVARRATTRTEHRAYSLMGIFHLKMPLLYSEHAFIRLQREIMQTTGDHSILARTSAQK